MDSGSGSGSGSLSDARLESQKTNSWHTDTVIGGRIGVNPDELALFYGTSNEEIISSKLAQEKSIGHVSFLELKIVSLYDESKKGIAQQL